MEVRESRLCPSPTADSDFATDVAFGMQNNLFTRRLRLFLNQTSNPTFLLACRMILSWPMLPEQFEECQESGGCERAPLKNWGGLGTKTSLDLQLVLDAIQTSALHRVYIDLRIRCDCCLVFVPNRRVRTLFPTIQCQSMITTCYLEALEPTHGLCFIKEKLRPVP